MKLLKKLLITEMSIVAGVCLGYYIEPDFSHAVSIFMLVSVGYLYGVLMRKVIGL